MMRDIQLTAKQIDHIKAILGDLRLTQVAVSERSGISKTHISNALSKRHIERGMAISNWHEFFDTLADYTTSLLDAATSIHEEPHSHEQKAIALEIGPNALLRLHRDIDAVRQEVFWPKGQSDILAPPGELILSETRNYIAFTQEDALHSAVKECKHFVGLILGPIKNGRSSLISRLFVTAKNSGHIVFRINYGNSPLTLDPDFSIADLYRFLFEKVAFQFDPEIKESGWQGSFIRHAEDQWDPSKPTTIFIEGLEALAINKKSKKTVLLFLLWLNSLRDEATKPPFDKFQILSIYTPYSEDGFRDSPFISQAKRTPLHPFTKKQCELLFSAYGLSVSPAASDKIFEAFLGQPYLTHCLVHSVYEGGGGTSREIDHLVTKEIGRAMNLEGHYLEFWASVRRFLGFALDDVEEALASAQNASQNLSGDERRVLELSGAAFVDVNGNAELSGFSRAAIGNYSNG